MAKSESIYVNFDKGEFLVARRSLLDSTIATINLLKRYKAYKEVRKEEQKVKKNLITEIKACNSGINDFIESVPKIKEELTGKPAMQVEKIKPKKLKGKKVISKKTALKKIKTAKRKTSKRRGKSKTSKVKVIKETGLDSELADIKSKLASLG